MRALLSRSYSDAARHGGLDPLDSFHQILVRIGVAEADVAFAIIAKGGAAQAGNAAFVQQIIGELFRFHTGAGDIGESVEGAAGQGAAKAGHLVETGAKGVAAAVEFSDHGVNSLLRAIKRGESGALCKAGGAGV